MLEEHALDTARHDRTGFRCGVAELDEYLQRFAAQQSKRGVAVVRVLVESNNPNVILGYYTLSAAQVDVEQLTESDRKKLPRYPVPCFRMGRLATDKSQHGSGLGKLLIGLAVARCLEARKQVASYALIVDANNERAKSFYKYYGFTACANQPMTLYLPLA